MLAERRYCSACSPVTRSALEDSALKFPPPLARVLVPVLLVLSLFLPAPPVTASPSAAESQPEPPKVGIATFNVLRTLEPREARKDVRRLLGDKQISVIGWQEADARHWPRMLRRLSGRKWDTAYFRGRGAGGQPISWRTDRFRLISSDSVFMHPGASARHTSQPYGAKSATRVVLQMKRTPFRTFTIINAHLAPYAERLNRPGRPRPNINARHARRYITGLRRMFINSPGYFVAGTGDFNFSYIGDRQKRPTGFMRRQFRGVATSSYQALGTRGLKPTHVGTDRFIDYVFLADRRRGQIRFGRQRVVVGLRSDHRALVVRLKFIDPPSRRHHVRQTSARREHGRPIRSRMELVIPG